MLTRERRMTADEFWDFVQRPENADRRFELIDGEVIDRTSIDGEVIEVSNTGFEHGDILHLIALLIGNFVRDRRLGKVTAAETGYILVTDDGRGDIVRGLDLGFIRAERLPKGRYKKHVPFAPDLAVEVISPSNSADETHRKVLDLLHAGTRIVWVFYPASQSVAVHTPDGAFTVEGDGVLRGDPVLPGFTLPLREVFVNDEERE